MISAFNIGLLSVNAPIFKNHSMPGDFRPIQPKTI